MRMHVVSAAVVLTGLQAGALGQVFHRNEGWLVGISDEGGVAVGSFPDYETRRFAMTWTLDGGINRIGLDPVMTGPNGSSVISGDGSTVIVSVASGANRGYFRYLGPGNIERITNTTSYSAFIISDSSYNGRSGAANGYGTGQFPPTQAGRWSVDGGCQLLGWTRGGGRSFSEASSGDGNTIVGWSTLFDHEDAFVWTAATGMRILQPLSDTIHDTSYAYGISSNGRFIVGQSGENPNAVMWRDGVIEALGFVPGFYHAVATSVSDDGTVVVGKAYNGQAWTPFVWTSAGGVELMADYLARLGAVLPEGFLFNDDCRVAANGRTFFGNGWGQGEFDPSGFVVTIPAPGALGLVMPALCWARRRRVLVS